MITFAPGLEESQCSEYSRGVLADVLRASGNDGTLITGLGRTPEAEARAIHDNCLHHGVEANRQLYTSHATVPPTPLPGCQVIDVYVADGPKSAEETIADMTAKIIELGPEKVSHHCIRDPARLNVIDNALSGLKFPTAFVVFARRDPRISKVLDETAFNRCIHVEIPQPEVTS